MEGKSSFWKNAAQEKRENAADGRAATTLAPKNPFTAFRPRGIRQRQHSSTAQQQHAPEDAEAHAAVLGALHALEVGWVLHLDGGGGGAAGAVEARGAERACPGVRGRGEQQ